MKWDVSGASGLTMSF